MPPPEKQNQAPPEKRIDKAAEKEKPDPKKSLEEVRAYINSKEFGDTFQAIYNHPKISQEKKDEVDSRWRGGYFLGYLDLKKQVENMDSPTGEAPWIIVARIKGYRGALHMFMEDLKKELHRAEKESDEEIAEKILKDLE